jgi:hypothetical protein
VFLVLATVALVLLAISNDVVRDINAFYFPDESNPVENWYKWGFIVLAVLCLTEAIFAVVWKTVKKSKHNFE